MHIRSSFLEIALTALITAFPLASLGPAHAQRTGAEIHQLPTVPPDPEKAEEARKLTDEWYRREKEYWDKKSFMADHPFRVLIFSLIDPINLMVFDAYANAMSYEEMKIIETHAEWVKMLTTASSVVSAPTITEGLVEELLKYLAEYILGLPPEIQTVARAQLEFNVLRYEQTLPNRTTPSVLQCSLERATPEAMGGEPLSAVPGGILLQSYSSGLPTPARVKYHSLMRAFIFADGTVYFPPVEPTEAVLVLRAVSNNPNLGVSLEGANKTYGALPPNSSLALDMKIADLFLADIVFGTKHWTKQYRFPSGYDPRAPSGSVPRMTVLFRFSDFGLARHKHVLKRKPPVLRIALVPLSGRAPSGGFLPDWQESAQAAIPTAYQSNAQHLATHIDHYAREPIIRRMLDIGEFAAVARTLKQQHIELEDLASGIESGIARTAQLRKSLAQRTTTRPRTARIQPKGEATSARVVDVDSPDVLNIREAPGDQHDIVGTLAYDAAGIDVWECRAVDGYRHQWCRVTHRNASGWVYGKYLSTTEPQRANAQ